MVLSEMIDDLKNLLNQNSDIEILYKHVTDNDYVYLQNPRILVEKVWIDSVAVSGFAWPDTRSKNRTEKLVITVGE